VPAVITIHYLNGGQTAKAAAMSLEHRAKARGFAKVALVTTGHRVEKPFVRYFHPQDRAAALRVAQALSDKHAAWGVEDCTRWRHRPAAGVLQAWPATP
jgi:predicted alpha/beta-fold hydrolase